MLTAEEMLEANGIRLHSYKPGQHSTICPECSAKRSRAHQRTPCLGVKIDGDGATWYCNHCGWSGPEKGSASNGQGGEFAATYDYPGFQKVRYPKGHEPRFRIRHRDGGGWKWGAGAADMNVLYRRAEIDEALALGYAVVCVEGEKDADRLWSIGIPATCNSQGASEPDKKPKWKAEHSEQLRGADVVVIPDHDPPGYAHADATCRLSLGVAKRVRRLALREYWPECPKGGDVSDWLDAGHTREELDALIEQAPDYLPGTTAEQPSASRAQPIKMTNAEDLKTMRFNPLRFVVPGIFVEGLTLLAGKPKIGKSWFILHAGIAIARGGFTLGETHCAEGDVLYCALEDNERRMQSRMNKLIGITQDWPRRLTFCHELPRLGAGGADIIHDWIVSHPEARMVAIDPLAMIRSLKKTDESSYQSDYLALIELRKLANEHRIALPVIHHLRKAEADDPYDQISGTLGLTGAVDSMLVLKRQTGGGYVLHGKGRDLTEIEKALTFDRDSCLWRISGDAAPVQQSAERAAIINAITEAGQPIGPNDIATATRMKPGNVRFLLFKLANEGAVEKAAYGKYEMPGTAPAQSAQVKQPGKATARTAKARSDDTPYRGPVVTVPDWQDDGLDEHGAPRKASDE